LSASKLELFNQCPFTFAAAGMFGLSDALALDLDLDASIQGQLLHAALQIAWSTKGVTPEDCERFLDQAREQIKVDLGEKSFWESQRAVLAQWLYKTLVSEMEWMALNGSWRETWHEMSFRGWISPKGELTTNPIDGRYLFEAVLIVSIERKMECSVLWITSAQRRSTVTGISGLLIIICNCLCMLWLWRVAWLKCKVR